jgi:hypothetical protein
MKNKIIYIFWGIVLLATGGTLLGGYDFAHLSQQFKLGLFAVASAAFFVTYFVHGVRNWGWLFPALFCAGIAMIIGMELSGINNSMLEIGILFMSPAVPFYVGYAVNRTQWGLLIPANILAAFTVFATLIEHVNGQLLTALVIYAIGMPFLVIYLLNRSRRWALITTLIVAVCGTMPLLDTVISIDNKVQGMVFLFLFALGFIAIAVWSKKNWWAIIPGGLFASLGLSSTVEILVPHKEYASLSNALSWDVYIWVLFLGLAVTFGVLWLRRKTQPTDWAKYPAAGLLAIAVLSFIEGARFAELWPPTVMLVIGAMFLLAIFPRKNMTIHQQTPKVKA